MSRLRRQVERFPWPMLAAVLLLCGIGLWCLQADDPSRAAKQGLWMLAGLLVLAAAMAVPYRRIGESSYIVLIVTVVMLLGVMVLPHAICPVRNGARRWFKLGPVYFQPSELAKIAFVLALAWYLRFRKNYRSLVGLLLPFLLTLVPMGLVLVEPDLGTALIFLPVLFAMLYLAGARSRHLLTIILLGVICMPAFWPVLRGHQKERIQIWLTQGHSRDPVLYDKGYQLRESLLAVGSGGLTGQGGSESIYTRYELLPEDNTDFIFSLIANQWGFAGCGLLLAAYLVLFIYGVEIAATTVDPFGRLLAVGVVGLFATQMLINIGMALALLPITGMTLPFVSYGGSSLLVNFAALGLLINVNLRRPIILAKRRFDWDEIDEEIT
ncbi:MAG: putative peptidoglycan glycosyltransferase FtsW [Phycisphaerae bacterium]|nr:putative peptidoglycan glycosyltransferase FtsW [Phycisphaerae bacterium]